MLPFEEKVRAGMAFLDEDQPGWELKIDCSKLDLSDSCACVLGQLEGDFLDAVIKYGWRNPGMIDIEPAIEKGFLLNSRLVHDDDYAYEDLTKTWITLTKERLDTGIDLT